MKSLIAFFKLIRWPNLFFIVLTQFLFWFFVLPSVYSGDEIQLQPLLFFLLMSASVCIAAAGYIINDYFDVEIDQINKSSKVIIGKFISRRSAILFHVLLSLTGLFLSIYVGYELHIIYIPLFNFVAIGSLVIYSTTFKKKLLIGNIIISLLTAWVLLVLVVAVYPVTVSTSEIVWQNLLRISVVYAGFAFIVSMIREVIKDMEDIEGDKKFGATTMPITWGLTASKIFAAAWIFVLAGFLIILQIYFFQLGWSLLMIYSVIVIIVPLMWVLKKLFEATTSIQFHRLSSVMKWIMLGGIISMIFFKNI
jgi:4-hydroxybenzoate polyprenyltransferase